MQPLTIVIATLQYINIDPAMGRGWKISVH